MQGRRALLTGNALLEGDSAERIISDRVDDPENLRAELIRLISGIRGQ
ncbi:hypothetical protein FHR32_002071 [Streptosporangium album]|uniref:Uncharacterized protein n=1 Tax=Streptosporangium album TaxID=47479 RepID=A0A7W7RUR4_9ACTN|nr:hypothetical protein [Streptosporangium album]MBB4937766.1 hypothetical protein [Streptosporangium album]